MNELKPINQTKLYGLNNFLEKFIELYKKNKFPNKILLSGLKGTGKSTLAYHFINYILSHDQEYKYNLGEAEINLENQSYKTVLNGSNPNFYSIDIDLEKKFIDINQIRALISNLSKSSFNKKPRFVLIDNIEFLNKSSVNALLKTLEEPSFNIYFILIHNNKKILPTLLSRCINFKISLSNKEILIIADKLLDSKLEKFVNKDLINYYITPGNIYNLVFFGINNEYDLVNVDLKDFLNAIIENKHYKKEYLINFMIFDFIEFYFNKINSTFSTKISNKYTYFLKRISDTKRFNLDEESLFLEFKNVILNG